MTIHYDFGYDYPYNYEVEYEDLRKALVKILCKGTERVQGKLYEETGAYQMAMYVVYNLDVVDELAESLEDELYEQFYGKALEQFEEREENSREEDDWYGTMSDVRGI